MIKKLVLAGFMTVAASSAFANNCTQQGAECRNWASTQGAQAASYSKSCTAEVPRCIARCKKGQKFFMGVSSTPLQYPITDCK